MGRSGAGGESARQSSTPARATSAEVGKATAWDTVAGAALMSPARGQVVAVGEEAVAVLDFVGELRSFGGGWWRCHFEISKRVAPV